MPRVLVVNNIPSPYNDALFARVAGEPGVQLLVAYCAERESNRSWRLAADKGYDYRVMRGATLGAQGHLNPGVAAVVGRFRPDVAVLSGSYAMPTMQIAAAALRARRTPWVFWSEEISLAPVPAARAAIRGLLRATVRRAHGVLAIGSRARRSFAQIGVPPARIADFRYYADVARFRLDEGAHGLVRAEVRAEYGIAPDAAVFLYCGQMIARKGVDTLLHAHARLRAGGRRAVLLLAGDGPEQGALESLAESLGTSGDVRFTGFVQPDQLPRVFAAGDAFVLPSRHEGWGVVVHEAMAAGLPVLGSEQVNAAADLVVPGESGWLFPACDADALAARMRDLLDAPDPGALRAAARRTAEAHAPERMAPRMVALLRSAIEGRDLWTE